jgi:hypothetical protein
MNMRYQLKHLARSALVPLLYRYPPFALAPERLYVLMHHLIETKDVPGAIVEVGCNLGGTAVIAKQLLDRLDIRKPYICIDTFDGFVDAQFATDVGLGTPQSDQHLFSGNSKQLVAKILRQHRCTGVDLVQGDVTSLPDAALPAQCSLVLADVDLTEPTYITMKRFWPRLAPRGAILVDDCPANSSWKARIGYSRFCGEQGLPERYLFGMGIVTA